MKIEFNHKTYELDLQEVTNKQMFVLQDYTGLTLEEWSGAIDKPDSKLFLKSITAMYWLMLNQNGEICPIADVEFPLGRFVAALAAAEAAEAAAVAPQEAEPDPTRLPAASASSPAPPSPSSVPPPLPAAAGSSPDG